MTPASCVSPTVHGKKPSAWQIVDPVLGDVVPVHPYARGSSKAAVLLVLLTCCSPEM